jgi:PPOX class probable F420-dependent enzyme
MPERQFATDGRDQQEAGSGYFVPAERARRMLLTAFERGGAAVSAPVRAVADGDRAYFWAWSGSGLARRLRHAGAVQVTPCSARGFLTYGLPLSATARLLPGDEASRATEKLAREHPVQHRFLIPVLQRARRRQMVIYELMADDAQGDQGQRPGGFRVLDQRDDRSGGHAVHGSREVARIHCVQTHVTDRGVASIACIWPAPAHVTLPSAKEGARQARSRAPGSTRPPAPPPGTP